MNVDFEPRCPPAGEITDKKTIQNAFGRSMVLSDIELPVVDQIAPRSALPGAEILKNPRVIKLDILPKIRPTIESVFGKALKVTEAPIQEQRVNRLDVMQSAAVVSVPLETPISKPESKSSKDVLGNFTATEETNSLKQKFNDGIAQALDREEVVDKIITESKTNIEAYQWEYTMSDPILVNPVSQNENGDLVNSKTGYSILAMTGSGERNGSVRESVVKTQELLKDANVGDTVMIVSPPGWSGRVDEKGKDIVYPEAEIFAFIKGEGRNIRALTFVADLNMQQCEEFRNAFIIPDINVESQKQSERDKIVQMVASPVLVTGGTVNFVDILDKIQAIKGGKIMREANGASRTFQEAHEFLGRGEELQQMPKLCGEIIDTYELYLRENIENINNPNVFNAIKQRMELTVLEIAKVLRGDKKDQQREISAFYKQSLVIGNVQALDTRVINENYDHLIQYLITRPGCNGGGISETSFRMGSSLTEILSGTSGGSTLRGMSGIGLSSGEVTHCKSCGDHLCGTGKCNKCKITYTYKKAA